MLNNFNRVLIIFLFVFTSLKGQTCDKKISIYFDSDKYMFSNKEFKKIDSLIHLLKSKKDTFYIEIHAHTDSVASTKYNSKLAGNRINSVLEKLKRESKSFLDIREKIWGETSPLNSNLSETGRAKNRRVDILYWPVKNNRIVIKGENKIEAEINKNYFNECGICASGFRIREITSYDDIKKNERDISKAANDEIKISKMIMIDNNCPPKVLECDSMIIRIPETKFKNNFSVWSYSKKEQWHRNYWFNFKERDNSKKTISVSTLDCNNTLICGHIIPHFAKIKYSHLEKRMKKDTLDWSKNMLTNAADSSCLILYLDELSKLNEVIAVDSGISSEKIGYYFKDTLKRYQVHNDTSKCWLGEKAREHFKIPLSAYTKIIYFKTKKVVVKIPRKYRNYIPSLYIPDADTIIPIGSFDAERKYFFYEPKPKTTIIFRTPNNTVLNKNNNIKFDDLRIKFKKSKKYYKGKIRRKQLRSLISQVNTA